MTYDKTNWVDGVTPVSAQNMNKLETQYDKAKELVDTHKAEKATDVALGHVIVDNDTIQSDEDGVISVPDGVFQSADSASGNATYTDNMAAGATLTKNIALGSANYKQGIAVIKSSSAPGIMVFFTTVNTETLVTGIVKRSSDNAGSAWSRRVVGQVTDATKYGYAAVSGYFRMVIKEVYIDGSNLVLQFHNGESDAYSLNCTIDWRVW